MRTLHVITGLQKAAGTSVFCGELANGLVAAGEDVTIAVCDPARQDAYTLDPRVNLVSITSILQTSNSKLQTSDFSIVHIHALWSPILHRVSNWAHKKGMPVVWSPHGMLTPWAMNNKKLKKWLGWWLYQKRDLKRSALLHATAESEVADIRRMGLRNKVAVAPLGAHINYSIKHQECADGTKTLLFVSRIQKKKGLLNLARAWASLPGDIKVGWKVRIVGPDQEGHTAEVKAECMRLDILSDWEFVGPRYGDELQKEYANAALFVLPTHSENFGSVIIEALAHGVPVITTKGAPWYELEGYADSKLQIHDPKLKCGWWIGIGVDPLSIALREAMSLTELEREERGKLGRKLVEEKYSWDVVIKKMMDWYKCVLTDNNLSGWFRCLG